MAFDPTMFELNTLQQGASNEAMSPTLPTTQSSPVVGAQDNTSSLDLKRELATIQAMKQGPSGGLGQTIGTGLGTAVGGAVGGPQGAAAGGAIWGTYGSVVDYMINKDAKDKADRIRRDALSKEKAAMVKRAQSDAWLEKLAQSQNESIERMNQRATKYTVARQMQGQAIAQTMNRIAASKSREQGNRQSFLEGRI